MSQTTQQPSADDDPLRHLSRMSAMQRLAAAASFERAELAAWAANYPEEVPLVNGELPWIALRLVDLD
jgi:hypothetical protein